MRQQQHISPPILSDCYPRSSALDRNGLQAAWQDSAQFDSQGIFHILPSYRADKPNKRHNFTK
jgi:hypothetical protein